MKNLFKSLISFTLISSLILSCQSNEEKLNKQIEEDKVFFTSLISQVEDNFKVEITHSLKSIQYLKDSSGYRLYQGIYLGKAGLFLKFGGYPNDSIEYNFTGLVSPDGNYQFLPNKLTDAQLSAKIENLVWRDVINAIQDGEGLEPSNIIISKSLNLEKKRRNGDQFTGQVIFQAKYVNKLSGYRSNNDMKFNVEVTYDGESIGYEFQQL